MKKTEEDYEYGEAVQSSLDVLFQIDQRIEDGVRRAPP
jgi:hypothetical protein